jgi:hypothetical protein
VFTVDSESFGSGVTANRHSLPGAAEEPSPAATISRALTVCSSARPSSTTEVLLLSLDPLSGAGVTDTTNCPYAPKELLINSREMRDEEWSTGTVTLQLKLLHMSSWFAHRTLLVAPLFVPVGFVCSDCYELVCLVCRSNTNPQRIYESGCSNLFISHKVHFVWWKAHDQ